MGKSRKLLVLGLLLLAAAGILAVRETHAEPLFFLPASQPQQIRLTVTEEPAGMSVYLNLLTAEGRETRTGGQAEMTVSDARGVIYRKAVRLQNADFASARLPIAGQWQWSHAYGFGWLSYGADLDHPAAGPGKVEVTFRPAQGDALRAAAAVNFPG